MHTIHGGRCSGKTWRLMEDAYYSGGLYLVFHAQEADHIRTLAGQRWGEPGMIWANRNVRVATPGVARGVHSKVVVDNVDLVLSLLLGRAVDLATYTGSSETLHPNIRIPEKR